LLRPWRATIDPQVPFVGSDGLEYFCLADKILGKHVNSWRNREIISRRKAGHSESSIRNWLKAYDEGAGEKTRAVQNYVASQVVKNQAWIEQLDRKAAYWTGAVNTF